MSFKSRMKAGDRRKPNPTSDDILIASAIRGPHGDPAGPGTFFGQNGAAPRRDRYPARTRVPRLANPLHHQFAFAHGMFPCSGNAGGAKSHIHGEIVDPVLQSELAALQVQTAFGTHTCLSTARSLFSFLQKPSFMLASFTSSLQG